MCKMPELSLTHLCASENQFTLKINKMNKTEAKGNMNELIGKLKQRFAVLTDNDLMYNEGKEDEMWGKVQKKVGQTKEELLKLLGAD